MIYAQVQGFREVYATQILQILMIAIGCEGLNTRGHPDVKCIQQPSYFQVKYDTINSITTTLAC